MAVMDVHSISRWKLAPFMPHSTMCTVAATTVPVRLLDDMTSQYLAKAVMMSPFTGRTRTDSSAGLTAGLGATFFVAVFLTGAFCAGASCSPGATQEDPP